MKNIPMVYIIDGIYDLSDTDIPFGRGIRPYR